MFTPYSDFQVKLTLPLNYSEVDSTSLFLPTCRNNFGRFLNDREHGISPPLTVVCVPLCAPCRTFISIKQSQCWLMILPSPHQIYLNTLQIYSNKKDIVCTGWKKNQQIYSLAYCPTNWYSKLKKEIKKNFYAIADITPYACETS